jgi:Icc-related predicted phosphoesterase
VISGHIVVRLVFISDTHSKHRAIRNLPDGDILIHCGDSTSRGTVAEITEFNRWLGELPHKNKVVIAGNHDWLFETEPKRAEELMTHATYLLDRLVTFEGLQIYGAPWQPWFFDWAFNVERGPAIAKKWALIPSKIDVLVTHGPPHGVLDKVYPRGELVGCEDLLATVRSIRPRIHAFGHIHEGYGSLERDGVTFVNASICNQQYQAVNAPIVVDL